MSERVSETVSLLHQIAEAAMDEDVRFPAGIGPAFFRQLRGFDRQGSRAPRPHGLVGAAGPADPATWHVDQLEAALSSAPPGHAPARAGYHARSLLRLVTLEPGRWPLRLSVIVPVHNRASLIGRALRSAQLLAPFELIVVDDGSTDDLAGALDTLAQPVELLTQEHRGVAAARNVGAAAARGELLHFLDSDNEVDGDAGRKWAAAFDFAPDAGLCYSPPRERRADGSLQHRPDRPTPTGGDGCPTVSLLPVAARRHPFNLGGAALPRWVFLATGGFDESLSCCEDTRLWFRLGWDRRKVVGFRLPLMTRWQTRGSLSDDVSQVDRAYARVALMNLSDLLEAPDRWQHIGGALRALRKRERWRVAGNSPELAELRSRIVRGVEALPERAVSAHLSAAAPLAVLAQSVEAAEPGSFREEWIEACRRAGATAGPPRLDDLLVWTRDADGGCIEERSPAIEAILRRLGVGQLKGAPIVPLPSLPLWRGALPRHARHWIFRGWLAARGCGGGSGDHAATLLSALSSLDPGLRSSRGCRRGLGRLRRLIRGILNRWAYQDRSAA